MQLCEFMNGCFPCFGIFNAVISKRFGAAGLKDVCNEASLIDIGSVDIVLKGKLCNKWVRALKIIYEAL